MASLSFIRSNPVTDAFADHSDRLARQREEDESRQVDAAYRAGIAELQAQNPDPDDPILSRLSATPGGGDAAFARQQSLAEQEARRQEQEDQWEKLAIQGLAQGDMTTYDFYSRKAGLELPPEVVNNAKARSLISRGLLVTNDFYKSNPQQGQRFFNAFIQSGGDIQAAYAAAGPPQGRSGRSNVSLETVMRGDQRVLAMINRSTGQFQGFVQDNQGQPLVVPGGSSSRGSPAPSAWQQKYDAWLKTHPGDVDGALDYANGGDGRPGGRDNTPDMVELRRRAYDTVSDDVNAMGEPLYATEAERRAAADELVGFWTGNLPTTETPTAPETDPDPQPEFGPVVPPMDEPGAVFTGQYHEGMPVFRRPDGSLFAYAEN